MTPSYNLMERASCSLAIKPSRFWEVQSEFSSPANTTNNTSPTNSPILDKVDKTPVTRKQKLFLYKGICVLHILAAATNQGRHLFCLELPIVQLLFEGGDALRVTSNQRNVVHRKIPRGTCMLFLVSLQPLQPLDVYQSCTLLS